MENKRIVRPLATQKKRTNINLICSEVFIRSLGNEWYNKNKEVLHYVGNASVIGSRVFYDWSLVREYYAAEVISIITAYIDKNWVEIQNFRMIR